MSTIEKELRKLLLRFRQHYFDNFGCIPRQVPFQEYLSDRYEKAKNLGFGDGTSIYESAFVIGDVKVGKNTWIGPYVMLDGSGGLSIGDNCSISTNVQIYSHDSIAWALSGGKAQYEYAPVTIGNHCYIAPNVVISKGVTIDDNCLVGANSLVNKDVPPLSIVAGNPAKPIGYVTVDKDGNVKLNYNKR